MSFSSLRSLRNWVQLAKVKSSRRELQLKTKTMYRTHLHFCRDSNHYSTTAATVSDVIGQRLKQQKKNTGARPLYRSRNNGYENCCSHYWTAAIHITFSQYSSCSQTSKQLAGICWEKNSRKLSHEGQRIHFSQLAKFTNQLTNDCKTQFAAQLRFASLGTPMNL